MFWISILIMLIGAGMVFYALSGITAIILGFVGLLLFALLKNLLSKLYHGINMLRINSEYVEKKEREKRIQMQKQEKERLQKIEEKERTEEDNLNYSANRKVSELREKYPLADESLFSDFKDAYLYRTIKESKEIAKKIETSHKKKKGEI